MTEPSLIRAREAIEADFEVTYDDATLPNVRFVEAVHDGTRYAAVMTRRPADAPWAGPVLVTVLHPWTAAKVMQDHGYLDPSYVREHLHPLRHDAYDVDVYAMTLTIRYLLDRTES